MHIVIKQTWEESEAGWGIRPDGYSLHLTNEDRDEYIREYWDSMPDDVQHEYSRPSGSPTILEVPDDVYKRIVVSKNGIRI